MKGHIKQDRAKLYSLVGGRKNTRAFKIRLTVNVHETGFRQGC